MRLSARTKAKLARLRKQVARLPVREQPLWRRRIDTRLKAPPALVVSGPGDVAQPDPEWDLQVANWLDNAYNIVSDRATQVRKDSFGAISDAGFSLWPVAIVVGIVALSYFGAARAHRGY
jgi:hypothetical protein